MAPSENDAHAVPLSSVPRPALGDSAVALDGTEVGGLSAIRALWAEEGGEVLLHGRRPFLDVTGDAGFDSGGRLTGEVALTADLTILGVTLGSVRWSTTVDGSGPLPLPTVTPRGATLEVDVSPLRDGSQVELADGTIADASAGTVTVDLPHDAVADGEPLSPRIAELLESLRGWDVTGLSVHRDAPLGPVPAFVAGTDLFFAPGRYGVDTIDTAAVLDAAIRTALAGNDGAVQPSPPAPAPSPGSSASDMPPGPSASPDAAAMAPRASAGAPATPSPVPADSAPTDSRGPRDAAEGPGSEPGAAAESHPAGGETDDGEPAPVELLMTEAPTEPTPAARSRGSAVAGGARSSAGSARAMPTAGETTDAARGAVEEPAAETAARAQEAIAEELGERPPPSPAIVELAERIRTAIRDNRPEDEDELLRTDPTDEARDAGATVTGAVESQAQEVGGAYDEMSEPATGEPGLTPEPAPAQDPNVPSMSVDASAAAPDPVPESSRSLDGDVAATDSRIAESGIDTRVTREIPDGPFAETRAARGELGELAERTPAEISAEEQTAIAGAQADMARLQLEAMESMRAARGGTVGDVGDDVAAMTGQEELTRDTVAQRAQGIFDTAEQRVTTMLEPLSRTALARWDTGLTRLSREFNDTLDDVQEWIDERHSGVGGTILAVGDALFGLPGWVTREYNRAEREFGDGVADLLIDISRDVNTIVVAAQGVIQTARDDIDSLFDQMEAEFPEWAAQERDRFTGMLDGLDRQVADAQTSFVRDVRERAITAVNEAHATVEAKREEAGGLIGQVVAAIEEFIDDPARAIINGLLRLVGIAPGEFWALIAQIEQVIDDIAADPENFINNLVAGVKLGFEQFFDNFPTHLLTAFWKWLFSGLETPIAMPTTYDPLSLMSFALELMGITWPNIREILVRHVGPDAVELAEAAWELLSVLIERGPEGIVEMVQEMLSPESIVGMILDAAIEYLVETLVVQVATYLFSLLNPAGAVAQAVRLIYQVCAWIFRNAARIFSFVQAVVGGIADVIAGNITGMAATVERALVMMIVVAIDFLAGLLGLSGLPDEVAQVIERMQAYVLSIVERIIVFFVERGRALLARVGLGGEEDQDGDGNDDDELGTTVRFSADGDSHRLYFQTAGDEATLMVASTPTAIIDKIADWRGKVSSLPTGDQPGNQADATHRLNELDAVARDIDGQADALAEEFLRAAASANDELEPPSDDALENRQRAIARMVEQLFDIFGDRDDESSRLADVAAQLPVHARQRAQQITDRWATQFTDGVQHLPPGSSEYQPLWTPASLAADAMSAAMTHVSRDAVHREHLAFFEEHPRSTASSPSFFQWSFVRDSPVRDAFQEAMGQAYVSAMRGEGTSDLDVVDAELRAEIAALTYHGDRAPYGEFRDLPDTGDGVDPALRSRSSDIIAFFKGIALHGVYQEYRLERLVAKWVETPNKELLHARFRNAPLRGATGGFHEWIPTSETRRIVEHAALAEGSASSGTRFAVQWINAHHHLRSETHRVYARVLSPARVEDRRDALEQANISTHAGAVYQGAGGQVGAGLVGQKEFHDELRAALPTTPSGETPLSFIERLRYRVADLLWYPDPTETGVPPEHWNDPIGLYFVVGRDRPRDASFSINTLVDRQWENVEAIDEDFADARANLDAP